MSSHRVRAVALLATLAVLVGGCGGGGADAYVTEYTRANDQFKRSVDEVGRRIARAHGLRARVPALVAFKASTDKLASDLDRADPPDEVGGLNDRAVGVLHRFSGDLDSVRQAAAANDKRRVGQLAPRLQSDQAELQDVLDEIDQTLRN
jgi:hypothetical protein